MREREREKMVIIKEICIIICIGVSVHGQMNLSPTSRATSWPHIALNEGAFSKQTIGIPRLGSTINVASKDYTSLSSFGSRASANVIMNEPLVQNGAASIRLMSNLAPAQNSAASIRMPNLAPPQNEQQQQQANNNVYQARIAPPLSLRQVNQFQFNLI